MHIPVIPSDFNLADPQTHLRGDINDFWTSQRENAPLAWHKSHQGKPGFWVVADHATAMEVYRNGDLFTSSHGNILDTLINGGDSASGMMLAVSDGLRHREVRKELIKFFSVQKLDPYYQSIELSMDSLIRGALGIGEFDFAQDIAPKIPLSAICDMLQVAEADRAELFRHASLSLASPDPTMKQVDTKISRNHLLLYFYRCIDARETKDLGDDLISSLIRMARGPLQLSKQEQIYNCYSLLLGGDETSRLLMIGTIKLFAEQPSLWSDFKKGNFDLNKVADELLRWLTPGMHGGRTVQNDCELGGQTLKAGDIITVWNNSANRDHKAFEYADTFLLERERNQHLSFAFGAHYCLGARLAKIEIVALLRALKKHVNAIGLCAEAKPIYSTFLSGYHSLSVKFD